MAQGGAEGQSPSGRGWRCPPIFKVPQDWGTQGFQRTEERCHAFLGNGLLAASEGIELKVRCRGACDKGSIRR